MGCECNRQLLRGRRYNQQPTRFMMAFNAQELSEEVCFTGAELLAHEAHPA
jgi:hypothetical protein